MAEVLGVAASVIGVLQLTGSVISFCYEYRAGVKGARKEILSIIDELNDLRDIMESILRLVEKDEAQSKSRLSASIELCRPDGALMKCKDELSRLEERLSEPRSRMQKLGQLVVWPLKEKEVAKILQHLQGVKASFNLALVTDQT